MKHIFSYWLFGVVWLVLLFLSVSCSSSSKKNFPTKPQALQLAEKHYLSKCRLIVKKNNITRSGKCVIKHNPKRLRIDVNTPFNTRLYSYYENQTKVVWLDYSQNLVQEFSIKQLQNNSQKQLFIPFTLAEIRAITLANRNLAADQFAEQKKNDGTMVWEKRASFDKQLGYRVEFTKFTLIAEWMLPSQIMIVTADGSIWRFFFNSIELPQVLAIDPPKKTLTK